MVAMSLDRRLHVDAQIVGTDAALDVSAATVTVDNGGTFATQVDGAALTALQLIDDIVFTDDTSTHATGTTKGAGIMAAATPTDGSVDANDIAMLAMSLDRRLHTDAQIVGTDAALDVSAATVTVDNGGTFATQVDGAALTALQLIDDVVFADDAAFTLGTSKGVMMMGFAGTQSVDSNDAGAIAMDTDGAIHIADGGNSITVDGTVAVSSITTSVTPGTAAGNLGKAEDAGHTSGDVGVMSLAVRTDTAASRAGTDADYNPLQTDNLGKLWVTGTYLEDAAHSSGDKGIQMLAVRTDTLAARAGTDGDYAPLQVSALGALQVNLVPSTSNGLSIFRSLDIDETEEAVKATAGQVYHIAAFNTTAAPIYLKFYNATVATVVVGTTTPVLTYLVPGNADSDGAGFVLDIPQGIAFGTAITVAATTGIADNDTGAPGANACLVNVLYK